MKRRTLARVVDDAQVWRERIVAAHDKGLEAVFETGRLLVEAKSALPHGSFLRMVKSELPFSRSWANRLMAIASDHRIANVERTLHLPASAETLYELTKLDDGAYAMAEERGLIRPDVTRKEIVALRHEVAAPTDPKPEPEFDVSREESRIGDFCDEAMERWPRARWPRLAEMLRYHAEIIERSSRMEETHDLD